MTKEKKSDQDRPKFWQRLSKLFKRLSLSAILLIVIVVAVVGVIVYQNRGGEGGRLNRAISPYFQLPNETPTVATVTDKSKLSSQTFFQQAEDGDKLLIYSKSHIIVMYRPSIKKVVDIAPISQ